MSTYRLKGASGAVSNQSFVLGVRTVIGCSDDCDLRLEEPGVAPRHAEITVDKERLTRVRLDQSAELRVNGQSVDTVQLASGDELRIAACRFVLQAPGLKPAKVLTAEAVSTKRNLVPWLIVAGLLAAATAAWYAGLLSFG
jgi:pSer/pThr/pTyr-binding forkhead associated (FHA) protein